MTEVEDTADMDTAAIVVIATLDTKGPETAFVVRQIESGGYHALVLDTGITPNTDPAAPVPSITSDTIAAEVGESREDLASRMSEQDTRDRWIRAMAAGSTKVLKRLHTEGRVAGVIGLGGAQGTEVCSTAMRALPIGVPKMLVSTVASGRTPFGIYTGTRDLTIMHSVVDVLGLNSLTKLILTNAVGGVVGMVSAQASMPPESAARARVGISIYGNTTPAAMAIKSRLEQRGYEVFGFHCNGTGGVAMEELASEGMLDVILDLSTHELTDEMLGGIHAGNETRLVLGGRSVPRLVVPGALDLITFGPMNSVPERFRAQPSVRHNPNVSLVRATREQLIALADIMAARLNLATEPIAVVVPTGGWSFYNRDGLHFRDVEADQAFIRTLRSQLRPGTPFHEVADHVNDPSFADHVVTLFEQFWHDATVAKSTSAATPAKSAT
jgi:uncharacterized protein (UPF0261 family)